MQYQRCIEDTELPYAEHLLQPGQQQRKVRRHQPQHCTLTDTILTPAPCKAKRTCLFAAG
jgi:hypothetical protein